MRGKGRNLFRWASNSRITPAYAGKSAKNTEKDMHTQDHPRLCGEKPVCKAVSTTREGSPPPMRGKDRLNTAFSLSDRITPAYAGKSILQVPEAAAAWDHPRLCGEK